MKIAVLLVAIFTVATQASAASDDVKTFTKCLQKAATKCARKCLRQTDDRKSNKECHKDIKQQIKQFFDSSQECITGLNMQSCYAVLPDIRNIDDVGSQLDDCEGFEACQESLQKCVRKHNCKLAKDEEAEKIYECYDKAAEIEQSETCDSEDAEPTEEPIPRRSDPPILVVDPTPEPELIIPEFLPEKVDVVQTPGEPYLVDETNQLPSIIEQNPVDEIFVNQAGPDERSKIQPGEEIGGATPGYGIYPVPNLHLDQTDGATPGYGIYPAPNLHPDEIDGATPGYGIYPEPNLHPDELGGATPGHGIYPDPSLHPDEIGGATPGYGTYPAPNLHPDETDGATPGYGIYPEPNLHPDEIGGATPGSGIYPEPFDGPVVHPPEEEVAEETFDILGGPNERPQIQPLEKGPELAVESYMVDLPEGPPRARRGAESGEQEVGQPTPGRDRRQVKPTPGHELEQQENIQPTPGYAQQGEEYNQPTPAPAEGPPRARRGAESGDQEVGQPTPGRDRRHVEPTPGYQLDEQENIQPTPGYVQQGEGYEQPTPGYVQQTPGQEKER